MFGPTRDGGGDGVGYGATMTASIGFYLVCSAGMSIFNKLAITALPLPMTLVSIQMLFTVRAPPPRPVPACPRAVRRRMPSIIVQRRAHPAPRRDAAPSQVFTCALSWRTIRIGSLRDALRCA